MQLVRASELDENVRDHLVEVFLDGFVPQLGYFSKDRDRLARALAHIFLLDNFVVAVDGRRIVAMAGISTGNEQVVRLSAPVLREQLGLVKGTMAAAALTAEWEHPYPVMVGADWGSIQFVATAADHRRRGAARAVLEHILATSGHDSYILEVGDGNTAAVALFESLGFRETARTPDTDAKRSGNEELLYLRYDRPTAAAG